MLRRPIVIIIDHRITEVRVKLLQFLGKLVDGDRDSLQLGGAVVTVFLTSRLIANLSSRRLARATIGGLVNYDQVGQEVGCMLSHA